ncbi:MAG: hypothetical protein P0Y53_20325 [Candidatus Pseudobacter hemicellulosilyticus]|uniref:ABC transporter ATPase n=1 Tax=Candidatus Pseudobacter hemicellulosilyticus TaxID=3121375 RepID=A0AAJ5WMU4_9BACT|nr:MAG: hypothetical protein P0Y53_20325 [Pseudobacter sp.]
MNWNYQELLPADFSADSRVWVYQSSRLFTMGEALQIEDLLNHFVGSWKTHGTPVKGFGTLFFGQFVILMADVKVGGGVSGCSTDSSVRIIKQLEELYKVNMFDRQSLAFVIKDKVQLLPLSQLDYALTNGFVTAETPYFNNVVLTKTELENNWLIPAKNSWLARKLPKANPA